MRDDQANPGTLKTGCCIAGGGPAGMMLGFLLARMGVDVTVLEKHADFFFYCSCLAEAVNTRGGEYYKMMDRPWGDRLCKSHRSLRTLDSSQQEAACSKLPRAILAERACRKLFHNRRAATTVDISTFKLLSLRKQ